MKLTLELNYNKLLDLQLLIKLVDAYNNVSNEIDLLDKERVNNYIKSVTEMILDLKDRSYYDPIAQEQFAIAEKLLKSRSK